MTESFPRPALVVSRCLGFEPVRYNGQIVRDDFVQRLAMWCDVTVVCPEVEIGLGVPRPPVRLVRPRGGQTELIQPDTGRHLTWTMNEFASRFLDHVAEADGFVLKSRSPSCGLGDAKVFASTDETEPLGRESGMFARSVQCAFAGIAAIVDEASLHDEARRDRFLTLLFALARLRAAEAAGDPKELARFRADYAPLLSPSDRAADLDDRRRLVRALSRPGVSEPSGASLELYPWSFAPSAEPVASASPTGQPQNTR